ncbi:MAG: YceD family protein [Alphaproteobacteria bacterium]
MEKIENLPPEWSHEIDADNVTSDKPLKLTISAGKEEHVRLVQRLGVSGIEALSAELVLDRDNPLVVHVAGRIRAKVKQSCVVSLDLVDSDIDERFEAWFADPDAAVSLAKAKRDKVTKASGREVPILDESEDPEDIIDGKIDLGELVVQHLSLSLSPYPHADGADYEFGDDEPQKVPDEFKNNPFAALKDWKADLED